MITIHAVIPYRLTFTSAFHFGTGLREGLIHRAMARDADGFVYVPGSTLKGVLRERCEQLARLFELEVQEPHTEAGGLQEAGPEPDIITYIFGSRFRPGHLFFDDAYLMKAQRDWFTPPGPSGSETDAAAENGSERAAAPKPADFQAWQTEKRTQASLSRLTQTAQPGALYHSEYGIRGLTFEGRIAGMLSGTPLPDSDGNYPLLLLAAALLSLDSLGGNKSTGGGAVRCEIIAGKVRVDDQEISTESLLNQLDYLEAEFYTAWREETSA